MKEKKPRSEPLVVPLPRGDHELPGIPPSIPKDPVTGQIRVYDVQTGQPRLLMPIDAREQLKLGIITLTPPALGG